MVVGLNLVAVTKISDIEPILSNEFLNIQATTEFRCNLKHVCDIIKTKSLATILVIIFQNSNNLYGMT